MGLITGESVSKLLNKLNKFHGKSFEVRAVPGEFNMTMYQVFDHDKPITRKGHTMIAAYWLLTGILYDVQGRL